MNTAFESIITLIISNGYDALMLLLVCVQTWIAADALRPKKTATIHPIGLVNKRRTSNKTH
jgi:hypothetical protein